MPEQFDCPSCGAPLDLPENVKTTMRCPYCSASVVVPEGLRDTTRDSARVIRIDLSGRANVGVGQQRLPPDDPILSLLREGNKIEAIKLYRERTGLGLKEAKDAVEAIQAGLVAGDAPEDLRPAKRTNARAGCILSSLLFVVILAVGGIVTLVALNATTRAVSEANTIQEVIVSELPLAETPTPALAELVMTAGSEGTGAGQMADARSVSQDRDGTIYVAEYQPGRVQAFSAQGEFIAQWVLADPKQYISALAALDDGRVAVVTSRAVEIHDGRSGELLASWKDGEKSGYNDAWLLADGTLAVSRTTAADNDLLVFDMQGAIIRRIEQAFTTQTGESEMEMKVASDLAGNLYLLGGFSRLVLKYDPEGKFITRMGGEGSQPGQFTFPDDIAVDSSGNVFVSEGLNVIVFDPNGRHIGDFTSEGVASGLYVNQKDELLVAARSRVFVYKLR